MRTTVTIDDELYNKAALLADPKIEKSELFREAFKTYVRVQSAKRLARLAGSNPQMDSISRRAETNSKSE